MAPYLGLTEAHIIYIVFICKMCILYFHCFPDNCKAGSNVTTPHPYSQGSDGDEQQSIASSQNQDCWAAVLIFPSKNKQVTIITLLNIGLSFFCFLQSLQKGFEDTIPLSPQDKTPHWTHHLLPSMGSVPKRPPPCINLATPEPVFHECPVGLIVV